MKRIVLYGALACLVAAGCGDEAKNQPAGSGAAAPAVPPGGPPPGGPGMGAPGGPPGMPPRGGPPGMMGPPPAPTFSVAETLTPVPVAGGVAKLSPENTKIEFLCEHMPPKAPDARLGGFEKLTGEATVEGGAIKSVSVEVDAASLWSQFPPLTTHLSGADFFEVQEHPQVSFKSTSIEPGDEGKVTVNGDLTLHGVTKPISFPADVTVGDAGVTLKSQFSIDRTEFGMSFKPEEIAKKVDLSVVIGDKTAPKMGGPPGGPGRGGAGGPGGRGMMDPVAMFKQWDADGDGKLAGDEIPERMKQNIDAIDKDKDGAVTLEEFQERMRTMMAGRGPGGGPPGGGAPGGAPAGAGAPPQGP